MSKMMDDILAGMDEVTVRMKRLPDHLHIKKKVFVVCGPNDYVGTTITGYQAGIYPHDDMQWVIPKRARLSHIITSDYFEDMEPEFVPFHYMTPDEDRVKLWSTVFPVECSEEDWFKAIGKRPTFEEIKKSVEEKTFDSEDSLEDSELGSCCAGLASVRTYLIKCQENGGLVGWEVEALEIAMKYSTHDMPTDAPILTNILKQLAITWGEIRKEQTNG